MRENGNQLSHISKNVRVASGPNEIQACVDTQVDLFDPLGLLLLAHVCLMLVVNKVDNGSPRVAVVDVVTKSRAVDHSKLRLELLLFQLSLDDIYFSELVELLVVAATVVLCGGKLG